MTRTITNLWLDLVALLLMLGLSLTGGIMHFLLPPGTGHSRQLFGLGRHDYGELHFWLAAVTVVVLVLHVALHWSFVRAAVARSVGNVTPRIRAWLGWGAATLIIAGLSASVILPILGIVRAALEVEGRDGP